MTVELLMLAGIVHLLLTAMVYWLCRRRMTRLQAATEAGLVFVLPFFGALIVGITRFCGWKRRFQAQIDPHKLMMDNDVFTNLISYDENVIPLRDTFLVDDVKTKRRVFLDAVKQNVLQNPKVLKMATHDTDREIAYYAVSMLSNRIEALENKMTQAQERLAVVPDDIEALKQYHTLMKEYVAQDFVDPLTKRQKRRQYLELLYKLQRLLPDEEEYQRECISQQIALEDYAEAERGCQRYLADFPEDEAGYVMFIRLYHAMGDVEKLQCKLNELKASPIRLSGEALQMIRYWGGQAHA